MGSTKEGICSIADLHPKRNLFVASHPIAGTENVGPKAAFDGLFDNKITIICDEEKSNKFAIENCKSIYEVLKMKVLFMDSKEHDRHIAYVSHLSHITSFVLGQTVLEIEEDDLHVTQGRKAGRKDTKPRKKRYGGGKTISQKALDNLAKARAKRQENIARRKAEKAKKEASSDR